MKLMHFGGYNSWKKSLLTLVSKTQLPTNQNYRKSNPFVIIKCITCIHIICLSIRIDSTREMCRALKEHTLHIEEAVAQGENDRVLLVQQNQSTLEEYNVISMTMT